MVLLWCTRIELALLEPVHSDDSNKNGNVVFLLYEGRAGHGSMHEDHCVCTSAVLAGLRCSCSRRILYYPPSSPGLFEKTDTVYIYIYFK